MMRNILALALNDLAIAFKNKTIHLIFFIPCFVFIALKLIDQPGASAGTIKIALVQDYAYAPVFTQSVKAAGSMIEVTWARDQEEARRLLKDKKVDGVLGENKKEPGSLALLVLKKESTKTLAILQVFSALQKATEKKSADWITDIRADREASLQRETLPTWILMLVLLVGFIILPAQVAEEKEKNLILAMLQTPIREVEWLAAKLLMGMTLTGLAVVLLHLLGGFWVKHPLDYAALVGVAGFCFTSFGIFLGFLCRTQAGARTLGLLFYLPHLLPSALSDFSRTLTGVAPYLASYQFYEPLKSILLEDGRLSGAIFPWGYLLLVGSSAFYLSYRLMKKRWLM